MVASAGAVLVSWCAWAAGIRWSSQLFHVLSGRAPAGGFVRVSGPVWWGVNGAEEVEPGGLPVPWFWQVEGESPA
ncbi:hypothetical protein GCM10009753_79140 [Streptantibioticus ferralitis]